MIGGGINALCAILFIGAKNTKLIKYYFKNRNNSNQDFFSRYASMQFYSKKTAELVQQKKMEKRYMEEYERKYDSNLEQRINLISNGNEGQNDRQNVNYLSVFKEIGPLAIGTFIVMMCTFLYFPGLELSIKSQYKIFQNDDDWFGIILITEYNVADYIGRQFLSKYKLFVSPKNVIPLAIFRGVVIYPLFCVLYQQYIINDILLHFVNIIGAATNGYLICLMFIFLSDASNKQRKNKSAFNHISATIMTLSLNFGILTGSICAILLQKFLL